VWIGWANACRAAGCRGDRVREVSSATLVDIEYGKRSGTRGRDSKCNRSAGAPGADQKDGFVRRVIAFPLHPKDAAEAIEDGTDPASTVITTDHVERAHLPSSRMQVVDEGHHPLLVWHRHEHAGEIFDRSCTGDECGQVIRFDLERDANRVCLLFDEEPVQQLGRLGCGEWIAYQAIESSCSFDMRKGMHVSRRSTASCSARIPADTPM
jgi:hypothetical protein